MDFLDRFEPGLRDALLGLAQPVVLEPGELLVRRGEPGGDLYVLQSGRLEVVDARYTPPTILDVLRPGAVVGEMSFLDGAARSADVRAADPARVLVWRQGPLRELSKARPELGGRLYESIARTVASRARDVVTQLGQRNRTTQSTSGVDARRLADATRTALTQVEVALRQRAAEAAIRSLFEHLDHFQAEVGRLFSNVETQEEADEAASILREELHPFLVRSSLAERCVSRPQGVTATAEMLAHILVNKPRGDGRLGEALDRWVLARPTFDALRALQAPASQAVIGLANRDPCEILLTTVGTGSLGARLLFDMQARRVRLHLIDANPEALHFLDDQILPCAGRHQVLPHLYDPVELALGNLPPGIGDLHVTVLQSLLEYLPDHLVRGLLATLHRGMAGAGTLVIITLGASVDAPLIDHILRWPTVRRSPAELVRLAEAAGFNRNLRADAHGAGVLLVARRGRSGPTREP